MKYETGRREMEIQCRENGKTVILDVTGSLDLYHASSLKRTVDTVILQGNRDLIINLSGVEHLDSTGIGVLIMCNQTLYKNSGSLRLVNTSDSVNKVMTLTKIDKFFSMFKSEPEALASI